MAKYDNKDKETDKGIQKRLQDIATPSQSEAPESKVE